MRYDLVVDHTCVASESSCPRSYTWVDSNVLHGSVSPSNSLKLPVTQRTGWSGLISCVPGTAGSICWTVVVGFPSRYTAHLCQVVLGKLDSHIYINEARTHSHHTQKINPKWLKDVNIGQDTINLLEENIGKTFSDRSYINAFLGQSHMAIEIKVKINRIQSNISFCTPKKTINKTRRYSMD